MSAEPDLSGRWLGIFNYPRDIPPTEFQADLNDAAGLVTGRVSEVAQSRRAFGNKLQASVQGRREGLSLRFTKIYDDESYNHLWVEYEGTVADDHNEIEGRWTVPGNWSGTFLMIRSGRQAAAADRRVSEKIETKA